MKSEVSKFKRLLINSNLKLLIYTIWCRSNFI